MSVSRSLTLAVPVLFLLSACSTVPSTTSLTEGIDVQKSASPTVLRSKDDPVCEKFYSNIYTAAKDAVEAKRNNADMTRVGAAVAGGFLGIPAGGLIASKTAERIIDSKTNDVSTQTFDPELKFDRRIIETAVELNCPIKIKDKTP